MKNRKIYRKRIFSLKTFFIDLGALYTHFGELKNAYRGKRVSPAFTERIMLSVTKVNGCRFCNFGHTKAALSAGILKAEVDELMNSDYGSIPEYEHKALLFAQHVAETSGKYKTIYLNEIINFYGEDIANDIMSFIRMIMFGNLCGNTLDAIIYRFKGYRVPDSNIGKELLTILSMVTILPIVIILGFILKRAT